MRGEDGRPYDTAHYGIKGDGKANDQPGLARLIADIPPEGGRITLPAGRFALASELLIPAHVTLSMPRGGRIVGGSLTIDGSIEAGLYQIFDSTQVRFGSGSREWAVPQWWGARGDGVHDDTDALQAALLTRIVFIPAGQYRVTRELAVRNRSTIAGVGNSWNPSGSTDSWIQYDGPADEGVAVLRVAAAPVGREPTSALDSIHVEKVVLNGGNRAGYGLYSVRCTSDSSFCDITARHCTQHGIFISQQWYSAYRNLLARDNAGCGITIGRVFPGWRQMGVNGLQISNIRASGNGTDRGFSESNRMDWGYGVLFCPGGGTRLQQVVSEGNYGAGLVYDLGYSCSNSVEGVYLEGNGRAAHSAGAGRRPWGLIVIGRRGARANAITTVYLHGEVGAAGAQAVWLTGSAPNGDLILRDVSFGHHLQADWDRYRFEGFVYYGLRNYITGERPRVTAEPGEDITYG